jgi:hypothetical protein
MAFCKAEAKAPGSSGFPGSQTAAYSWHVSWCQAQLLISLARSPDTPALPGTLDTTCLPSSWGPLLGLLDPLEQRLGWGKG